MTSSIDNKVESIHKEEGSTLLGSLCVLTSAGFSAIFPAIIGFKVANLFETDPQLAAKMCGALTVNMGCMTAMGTFGAYIDKKGTGRYAALVLTGLQAISFGIGYGAGYLTR
jgi:hypothetical protein